MKKIIFAFILIVTLIKVNAQQFSLGYYPFNNVFSITSNPDRIVVLDGRVETNTFLGNINPEIFGLINLKRSDLFNIYSGLSIKMILLDGFNDGDFIGGYSISIGARFKPLEKYNNLHFIFELSPYLNKELTSGILRSYLGISYKFEKDK